METGIRILLLTALLAALPGCASVRDWSHQRAERRAERRAAEAQSTEPRESEPPQDESAPPRVIEPEVSRRKIDRKSTRLNSSHSQISNAVFCWKKKKLERGGCHVLCDALARLRSRWTVLGTCNRTFGLGVYIGKAKSKTTIVWV